MLECWTVLSALAGTVPRVVLGPLVLNVANRDAGTLAVMAATLQEVSGGRLILGIGAGGRSGTPYGSNRKRGGPLSLATPSAGRPSSGQWRRCEKCGPAGRRGQAGFCVLHRYRRS